MTTNQLSWTVPVRRTWFILLSSITQLLRLWCVAVTVNLFSGFLENFSMSYVVFNDRPSTAVPLERLFQWIWAICEVNGPFVSPTWMALTGYVLVYRLREEFMEKLKKKTLLVLKKRWNLKLISECHPLLLAELLEKEAKRQVLQQNLCSGMKGRALKGT